MAVVSHISQSRGAREPNKMAPESKIKNGAREPQPTKNGASDDYPPLRSFFEDS